MAEQKASIKNQLLKADEKLTGSPALMGMTVLSFPGYINSMRSTMFTSHLKQFLNLTDPDFPLLFTNAENMVGKYSTGYKSAKSEYEVYKKIVKYSDIVDEPSIYSLFVYDKVNKQYDVFTRKEVENLTENFGYKINNETIDSFYEGDTIKKGTVLYKSSSYDEDMNYGYGKNVVTMYTLDPFTSEDAAVASRSLAEEFTSIETEVITIGLNDNDFLMDIFGKMTVKGERSELEELGTLPEIGQVVNGYLAAVRRQFNNQLLYDFTSESLKRIMESDLVYYIGTDNKVIDYTIYSNNEEIVDNPFTKKVNKYLRSQNKYYKKILKTCEEIINSGIAYSGEIDYLYKRAKEMTEVNKKWKEGDSAFSNMVIEITVEKVVGLAKGQKLTGRYGNKSVISQIREDDEMPYTEDGRRVDLLINLLAIVNRTTAMVLFELAINSITYQVRKKMKTFKTRAEKEALLWDIIYEFNEDQHAKMYAIYQKYTEEQKDKFIEECIENGIYIHEPPLWETKALFYRLRDILGKYDWLQPDNVYINKWGRKIKVLNKMWIAEMYILKLKQSDRRGFSARSTGAVDTKGLPTRSYKSRSHLEQYSGSAIRFGEFESLNFSIGTLLEDIALFHALYRTSIKGRKDLLALLFKNPDDPNAIYSIDKTYTSRVAEIFDVILKSMGIHVDFIDEDEVISAYDNRYERPHTINGKTVICTDYEYHLLDRVERIKQDIMDDNPIMVTEALIKRIEEELVKRDYVSPEEYRDDEGNVIDEDYSAIDTFYEDLM